MNIIKFKSNIEPFVTRNEVTVDIVIKYLNQEYPCLGNFVPDPNLPYLLYNDNVFNEDSRKYYFFSIDYIEEME